MSFLPTALEEVDVDIDVDISGNLLFSGLETGVLLLLLLLQWMAVVVVVARAVIALILILILSQLWFRKSLEFVSTGTDAAQVNNESIDCSWILNLFLAATYFST